MEYMDQTNALAALEAAIDSKLKSSNNGLVIVSIGGPSGSGKSTVVTELHIQYPNSIVIRSDDYYLGKIRARRELPPELAETFESPRTMDLDKLTTHLYMLKCGTTIERPAYNMKISEPFNHTIAVDPSGKDLIIFEGLVANIEIFKTLVDIHVCVTASLEIRLARRITRDATRNGQNAAEITQLFETTIEPAYELYYRVADAQATLIIDTSTE